ncbi:hypothetical protein ACXET9_03115 [Brachybacterium sp. DNPG3]
MRYRSVISMHFVNRRQAILWPLAIMLFALAIVLVIGIVVGSQGAEARAGMSEGMRWSGAIFALLGPMIGYGFVSMGQHFPLALGLGLTRREFATGLGIVFLGNALAYSLVVTIGKAIEVATDGYGLGVRFFDVAYTSTGSVGQTFVQTFLLITAVLFLGAAITSAHLRFGQGFLWTGGAVLAAIGVAVLSGAILLDGFRAALLDIVEMGWGPWMGVVAAIAVLAAAVWALMVRRTQVR